MFPFFSRPNAFAIDVTDESIQLLEVRGNGKMKVRMSSHVDLPKGIVQDGKILDPQKLSEQIKKSCEHATPHAPKAHRVVSALPESCVFSLHLSLDRKLNRTVLPKAILEQAERSLPISLDECVHDFQVLGSTASTHEILFAAASKTTVQAYHETLRLAGFDLQVLEPESLALCRAIVSSSSFEPKKGSMIFCTDPRSVDFLFVDAGGLQLSVTIPIVFPPPTKEAIPETPQKKGKGRIKAGEKIVGRGSRRTSAIPSSVIEEAKRAIDYYQRKMGSLVSRGIMGGGSQAGEWQDELSQAVGFAFEPATLPCVLEGGSAYHMSVVCGLAMRATRGSPGINFVQS